MPRYFYGTGVNDNLTGVSFESNVMYGYAGNDLLTGGSFTDTLYGGIGHDTLRGLGGNDYLEGHDGNDHLQGGTQNDTLIGGLGNDVLNTGAGNDRVQGGDGADHVIANIDNLQDTLVGGTGNDIYTVSYGGNVITELPGEGVDTIVVSTSGGKTVGLNMAANVENLQTSDPATTANPHLQVNGNNLANRIQGGNGNDVLFGSNGNDTLNGSSGFDILRGGNGNDVLIINTLDAAMDTLEGGYGNDRYVAESQVIDRGWTIINDAAGTADVLDLRAMPINQIYFFASDLDGDGRYAALQIDMYCTNNVVSTIEIHNYYADNSSNINNLYRGAGYIESILSYASASGVALAPGFGADGLSPNDFDFQDVLAVLQPL